MTKQSDEVIRTSRRNAGSGEGLRRSAILATAIGLLGLLCAFAIIGWQFIERNAIVERGAKTKAQHDAYTSYFNSRLVHLGKDVRGAAESALAKDAVIADTDAREQAGTRIAEVITYAERVSIIPKGKAEVDLSADVPITFAGLDVIKRAESQQFVGPEASISPPGLIYAASPITRDGTVAGVLFVVFSMNYLVEPLGLAFNEAAGQVSIEQNFDGMAPARVLQWGNPSVIEEERVDGKLSARHMLLTYQPAMAEAGALSTWGDLAVPFSLASILLLGGIGLAFSRASKFVQADANQLGEQVGRALRGRGLRRGQFKLKYLQEVSDNLAERFENGDDDDADEPADATPAAPKKAGTKTAKAAGSAKAAAAQAAAESGDEVDDLLAGLDEPEDDFLEVDRPSASDNFGIEVEEQDGATPEEMGLKLDPDIFRAYDIRGITTTNLTREVVYWVGRAFAAEALAKKQLKAVIGRDGRLSSPDLAASLAKGLTEGGLDVIDIGQVPTPVLYFATHALETGTGIMVTGSHNPPDYNGLKMVMAGETLAEERIKGLQARIENNDLSDGQGDIDAADLDDTYLDRILDDVAVAQPKKVVVDCGNGVAGAWAPRLIEQLGCEVIPLYCDVDGTFPNHHPDPAEAQNLEDLLTVVEDEDADLGLAFDGDGDRLGVVTPMGKIIWPDKLIMLFSQDIISRNPGADIIYDVKCSRHLNHLISECGGRPIMWKTGHSHIKAKMKETGALLGGEFSGHICFGERWYGFDDALYSAARLLEILGAESQDIDDVFDQYPETFSTEELKIQTTDKDKFKVMKRLTKRGDFGDGALTDIDGVRVDYDDGWGLIRPSNTSPVLSLRFEADTKDALVRIQEQFAEQLAAIDPKLTFEITEP